MRLDSYLAQYYPEYSRSTWQKYIKLGYVKVNDEVETSAKYSLGEDDEVRYHIPETPQQTLDIPIIFEDENVVVLDKPAGILTHSKGTLSDEPTVATWLLEHISQFTRTVLANENNRFGIVHRLDRDTSGVIIVAKNEETVKYLQKQFSNRTVKKIYIAVVEGAPKHVEANIELPIERNPKKPSQFRVGASGKPAITHYKIVKQNNKKSLLELKPQTGRTHQLRVHLSYIGTPIVGDKIYGQSAERMYLHAKSLELTLPGSIRKVFESPVPPEFEEQVQ